MTKPIETHKNLDVWARAMDVTEAIYRLSAQLPPDERFSLTAQMRRAAVSIPSNIAEGAARRVGRPPTLFVFYTLHVVHYPSLKRSSTLLNVCGLPR